MRLVPQLISRRELTKITQIVWDTTAFNNKNDWPEDGSQPLYLSTGDRTGYGQHGDYVFGWKSDSLQRALDAGCTGASCANLKVLTNDEAVKCKVRERVNEKWEGCEFLLALFLLFVCAIAREVLIT